MLKETKSLPFMGEGLRAKRTGVRVTSLALTLHPQPLPPRERKGL